VNFCELETHDQKYDRGSIFLYREANMESHDIRYWSEQFLEQRHARGYSEVTVYEERKRFRFLIGFFDSRHLRYPADITREAIREYVQYVREYRKVDGMPFTPKGLEVRLLLLRIFVRYLAQRRLILFDGTGEIPRLHTISIPRPALTAIQTERVLSLPDTDTPEGLRDRALLELLYATGIRRMELTNLMLEDVTMSTGMVHVRQGKGRKDRMIPSGERAVEWLRRYITESRPLLLTVSKRAKTRDQGYLFFGRIGQKMSLSTLTHMAGHYMRESGIEKGACHIFRHTAATLMLENGADMRYIQELLGHTWLRSTQVYTKVSGKHLRETFKRTHPSAWAEQPEVTPVHTLSAVKILKKKPHGKGLRIPDVDATQSPLHGAVAEYRAHLLATLSRSHTSATTAYLLWFSEWCLQQGYVNPGRFTTDMLEEYQKHLTGEKEHRRDRTISINEQTNRMRAVRNFFRFLFQQGKILIDPSAAIVLARKSIYLPPEPLTLAEVDRLLALPDVTKPYGLRDRAMMEMLFATGMRRQELVNLRMEDLDFERSMVRIHGAKTGDVRNIPAGDRAFKWLAKYIEEVRPLLLLSEDRGNVFLASHGEGMEIGLPSILLGRYFHLANIRKRSPVHVFRHTAATLMLENGADVRTVQEFLGHRSITSTQRYTHVSARKLKEVHAQTHPAERRYLEKMRQAETEAIESSAAITQNPPPLAGHHNVVDQSPSPEALP
jgi:integrase/recombinase XerD